MEIDAEGLRRGDPAAVDALYRGYARQVLAWVIRLGGPGLDPEEVAQDVFAVAIPRLSSFRGESRPSTWLFGITRNVVRNARRRAAFRRFFGLDAIPEPPAPGDGPEALVAAMQRRRRVQDALETLSPAHREVIVLVELEDRSAGEVAEMLGIPVGTVHSRLHHAKLRFAAAIGDPALPEAS